MTHEGRTRILIIDAEDIARRGMRALLEAERDFQVVSDTCDPDEAMERVRALKPDIVLIGIDSFGYSGTQAIYHIRQNWPKVAVVALSAQDDLEHVLRTIEAGANGYLLKSTPRVQLIEAIRTIVSGGAIISPTLLQQFLNYLGRVPLPKKGIASAQRRQDLPLTCREREVAQLLSYGFSNRQIAEHLGIGNATVKTHLQRIYRKLGLTDRTQVAIWWLTLRSGNDLPTE